GRIDQERPIHQADSDCADGAEERNIGKSQRAGSGVDAEHVRIIISIGGENESDDLRLALESLGKHGPNGAVNLAAGENFALTHAPFTLDEAAGEASASVGVLAIVHGEGKEVDAFAGIGVGDGGSKNNVFAQADNCCSVRLLGELSGFK